MITEDYVGAKTARLLKDKSFNIPCQRIYNQAVYGEESVEVFGATCNDFLEGDVCTAPTISVACKWLIEKKGIAIIPLISSILDEEKFLWDVEITTVKNKTYRQGWVYEHLEKALDYAIQWTLENLI